MSNSDPTLFERLAKVEPAKLARLLVELAAQDQTILEQVQFLLASGDTTAIAKAVRSTLRAWKRSPRFIHYQEAFAFGEQLDRLLDSVEDGLLGPDPALALDLLEEFLQSDRWILERVDDSAGCIGTAYRRACQLFARAAAGVASPAALAERIALLVEKDDYGVRHSLLEHVPQFLDSETIARLVDRWRKQAAQGPGSRRDRMPLLRIETLAASTGDPQLYADAALEGTSIKDQPVISLQVARQFVLAGRPAESLRHQADAHAGDTAADAGRIAVFLDLHVVLARIEPVSAGNHFQEQRVVGDRRCHRTGMIDGRLDRHDAGIRYETVRRLHAVAAGI